MQHGILETFEYFQCIECECIQIKMIPENMSKYYPNNYYSLSQTNEEINVVKRILLKQLFKYRMHGFNPIGYLMYHLIPNYPYNWIKKGLLNFQSKILDMGCGSGERLLKMKLCGFENVIGIDPFIEKDIHYKCGLNILKKDIHELNEKFDFIMMHHSLEHIADQVKCLSMLKNLLKENGSILIRIPVNDGLSWQIYKQYSFTLDAPRHFYLHSYKSILQLAEELALDVFYYYPDPGFSCIWLSENYKDKYDDRYQVKNNKQCKRTINNIVKQQSKEKKFDAACFLLKSK